MAEHYTLETFVPTLRKKIRDSYQSVGETMVAGGVRDMEQYRYLLGQAHALQLIEQEISNLLNPKEDKKNEQSTNVVKFGRDSEDETSS